MILRGQGFFPEHSDETKAFAILLATDEKLFAMFMRKVNKLESGQPWRLDSDDEEEDDGSPDHAVRVEAIKSVGEKWELAAGVFWPLHLAQSLAKQYPDLKLPRRSITTRQFGSLSVRGLRLSSQYGNPDGTYRLTTEGAERVSKKGKLYDSALAPRSSGDKIFAMGAESLSSTVSHKQLANKDKTQSLVLAQSKETTKHALFGAIWGGRLFRGTCGNCLRGL